LSQVYVSCDWIIKSEHLVDQLFIRFMEAAATLNCELWVDWWAEMISQSTRRLVLRAPSDESVKQLIEDAGIGLGLTTWNKVSYEYFLSVTKEGQVPSLQEMRDKNGEYFGRILEGFLARAYLGRN